MLTEYMSGIDFVDTIVVRTTTNKGTSKIRLSEMKKSKTGDIKGRHISTGKGAGRVKI